MMETEVDIFSSTKYKFQEVADCMVKYLLTIVVESRHHIFDYFK